MNDLGLPKGVIARLVAATIASHLLKFVRQDTAEFLRPGRIVSLQIWLSQTCCASIWIWEGVFVVFFVSIETSEILFNQEPE